MSDLISRQDAIDAVRKCAIKNIGDWAMLVDKAEAILALNALPSADTEWIPCSERLPDIGELVLITQNRGDGDKTVETAYLTSDGPNDLYWSIELFKSRETDEVLAWMPLPEPYREESEVEE